MDLHSLCSTVDPPGICCVCSALLGSCICDTENDFNTGERAGICEYWQAVLYVGQASHIRLAQVSGLFKCVIVTDNFCICVALTIHARINFVA